MTQQPIVRLDFADLRRTTDFRGDPETGSSSGEGIYFRLCESCRQMAAAISRTVADAIRPRDDFFGSSRTVSFALADRKFACAGVAAGIAGLATLLFFAWSEFGAGAVSATEGRAAPRELSAVPSVETRAERTEAIRQRGMELLRVDIPEDAPSQSPARGDRLESQDSAVKPVTRIATAGETTGIAAPAPLPVPPAADKAATAKEKAAKAKVAKERQARRAAQKARDQARAAQEKAAQAKTVQVPADPQTVAAAAPPEEDNGFGWVKRLPDTIAGGWDNLWAKGNGGGVASCGPSTNAATVCPREAQAGPR
jgi:ribonuclease E